MDKMTLQFHKTVSTTKDRKLSARKKNKLVEEMLKATLIEKRNFLQRGINQRKVTIKRLAEEQRKERAALAELSSMIDTLNFRK